MSPDKKNVLIARALQMTAHPSYILLGFLFFYGMQRPFQYYIYLIAFTTVIFHISIYLSNKVYSFQENPWSLTPFITAGNIILNMEAYSIWTYFYAATFAIFSRALLKTKDGHIFNPGYFGVFCMAMLFPKMAYPSIGLWQSNNLFVLFIFVFGNIVVYRAKRLYLIYSYIFSFSLFTFGFNLLCKLFQFNFNGNIDVSPLFWPATIITTTSFVFIFHVISDPKTSPKTPTEQIIFGLTIGTIDFLLRMNLILPAEMIAYVATQALYGIYRSYFTVERAVPLMEKAV
jgi:hypothetical protein